MFIIVNVGVVNKLAAFSLNSAKMTWRQVLWSSDKSI